MKRLELSERETILRFDEEADEATLFTYRRSLRSHMEKTLELEPDFVNDAGGAEYTFPKAWFRKPRKTRSRKGGHQ